MSDAALGTLVLFSPVILTVLMWPRLRNLVFGSLIRGVRLIALACAVAGILAASGDAKHALLEAAYRRGMRPHDEHRTERPPRHATPQLAPDTYATMPANIPADTSIARRPSGEPIEQYSPEWYDIIYDLQD